MISEYSTLTKKQIQQQGGSTCLNCGNPYKVRGGNSKNGQCSLCNKRATHYYRSAR